MKTGNSSFSRRRFLSLLTAGSAGLAVSGCGEEPSSSRYNDDDVQLLAQQRISEAAQAGKGPFGQHRYPGYRGLAELPWFDIDSTGQLRCIDEAVPRAVDIHCHLGMSVLFRPELDLTRSTERVKHLLDCDGQDPGCAMDLDIYANGNFDEQALGTLQGEIQAQGLWGSKFAATQTVPNLLREMDAMRVEQAVLLPIKLGFWFGDDLTEQWRTAVDKTAAHKRLLVGCSVHPRHDNAVAELRAYAKAGATVMKLHPTVQRFYPDDPKVMDLYEAAQELGVVIFYHGGRAGIELESSLPYAMPRHYEAAIANFPKLQFILGHSGARDFDAMLQLALRYDNAWLGIHGQSLTNLDTMINKTGGERLLFGTDWPFYHIGMSLAKVLIATQDSSRRGLRESILRGNAAALLGQSNS